MKTTLMYPVPLSRGVARFGCAPRRIATIVERLLSLFIFFAGIQTVKAQNVYVLNNTYVATTAGSVSVINSATNTVTTTISGLTAPGAATTLPNGRNIYVASFLNSGFGH
jgi:hypothetical protein